MPMLFMPMRTCRCMVNALTLTKSNLSVECLVSLKHTGPILSSYQLDQHPTMVVNKLM